MKATFPLVDEEKKPILFGFRRLFNNLLNLYAETMKGKPSLKLNDSFTTACNTFNIDIVDALEFYLKNINLYTHFKRHNNKLHSLASEIFNNATDRKGKAANVTEFKKETSVRHIRELLSIIQSRSSPARKQKRYDDLTRRWFGIIKPYLQPICIEISDGLSLQATQDFCILCYLFGSTHVKVLQHYINHVSLGKYLRSSENDAFGVATSFFLLNPPVHKRIESN